ncbi:hypothetical protein ACLUWS_06785 [Bifidobacterium boum]|uniref:nucleotide-binding protein n=1 Tax=Bifidobacterium boum TaxID=78343 RepID=UPI0039926B65
MNHLAPVTFITGGSGGLGKSTTARAIAHALGLRRMRTVLIDGNPGQQSQRAFLRIQTGGLEDAALDSIAGALIMPNRTHAAFALLPGPADPMRGDLVGLYGSAITALQPSCDAVIVDADRVDPTLWNTPTTFAGGVMRPMIDLGLARMIFIIGSAGSQLDDGLDALAAIHQPQRVLAIAQTGQLAKPRPESGWRQVTAPVAQWGGICQWDKTSTMMLDKGQAGYPAGQEPAWLAHACLWAGGRKNDFTPQRKGRRR